jgi:predicted phosphodiesterase
MNVLFVGDSHGNHKFLEQIPAIAKDADVGLVVQVGDFGFWPSTKMDEDYRFSNWMHRAFLKAELPLWVIRGNHDDLRDAVRWQMDEPDFSPGLHWVPDGFRTSFNGTSLCFTGGAVSVDQGGRKEGKSWWADEVTSDEDVEKTIAGGKVDLWVTHDSVDLPPGRKIYDFGPQVNLQVSIQRHKMRLMFEALQPRLHIHGHHHHRYTAPTEFGRVYGLGFESNDALLFMDFDEQVTVG